MFNFFNNKKGKIENTEYYVILEYLKDINNEGNRYVPVKELIRCNKDKIITNNPNATFCEALKDLHEEDYIFFRGEKERIKKSIINNLSNDELIETEVKINIRGRYFITRISEEANNRNTMKWHSTIMLILTLCLVVLSIILMND